MVSQSHSYFTTGDKPLETHDQYFFQLNTWGHNPYVIYTLTKGWLCRLQFLLASPAQSFSGQSRGTHDHVYCLRLETPPTWRDRSPYLYPPARGWPSYTPRHWVPFPSPPTTRRATVEVSNPASARDINGESFIERIYEFSSYLRGNTQHIRWCNWGRIGSSRIENWKHTGTPLRRMVHE
jgi:hypothetical protein